MAAFTIWNNQPLTQPAGMQPGVPVDLLISSVQSNSIGDSSLRLVVKYDELTPNDNDGSQVAPSYEIGLLIEGRDANNNWFPIGYQFNGVKRTDLANPRTILLQPDISDFFSGVDDSVFVAGREIARISRQQGILPPSAFRVRLILIDQDPTGPGHFVSGVISVVGEKYNLVDGSLL